MSTLISVEAMFGAGMLLLLAAAGAVAWCAGWLLWRVARWIMTGRL